MSMSLVPSSSFSEVVWSFPDVVWSSPDVVVAVSLPTRLALVPTITQYQYQTSTFRIHADVQLGLLHPFQCQCTLLVYG